MKGASLSILLLAFGATCASTRVLADDLLGFTSVRPSGSLMSEPQKKLLAILAITTNLTDNTAPGR